MGRKAKHGKYGQYKTEEVRARVTQAGKEGLEAIAAQHGVSLSEFLEQVGRGEVILSQSEQASLGKSLTG